MSAHFLVVGFLSTMLFAGSGPVAGFFVALGLAAAPSPPPPPPLSGVCCGWDGAAGTSAGAELGACDKDGVGAGSVLMPASWSFSVADVRTWGLYAIHSITNVIASAMNTPKNVASQRGRNPRCTYVPSTGCGPVPER